MSTLAKLSQFFYGTTVDEFNNKIDFSEGGPALVATLNIGDYSPTEYAAEWARALNAAGALDYTTSFDRATRKLTVSASGNFEILTFTGTHTGTAAWAVSGFETSIDHTGAATYTAENGMGRVYRPQYLLANYSSLAHYKVKESSVVNTSVVGIVQTLQFGDGARMRANIVVITNKENLKLSPFFSNASGVQDAIDFMDFLITKAKVEFMEDVDAPNVFNTVILESTKVSRDGTAYELLNLKGAKDFYETGDLLFRKAIA